MRIGMWKESVQSVHRTRKKTYCRIIGCVERKASARLDSADPIALKSVPRALST